MAPFEVEIERLGRDGLGVATHGTRSVRVQGGLSGERLVVRPLRARKGVMLANAEEVLRAAEERVTAPCVHHRVCGGCVLQEMDSAAQIAHKRRQLSADFEAAGVQPARWLPDRRGASTGYRRRARLGVRYVRSKDEVLVGFRERIDRRFVARMDSCAVLRPPAGDLVAPLAALIQGLSIRACVPQVEVAVGDERCVLVFRVLEPPVTEDIEALREFGRRHGVHVYLQPGGLDTIRPLAGEAPAALSYSVAGLNFHFTPTSFVQVNGEMNEVLVADAMQHLQLTKGARVLDLFCGLGNFTLPIAARGAHVLGVEGEGGLVELGRENAARNHLSHATFERQNLYEHPERAAWASGTWDRVLLDPPRTGAEDVVRVLGGMKPQRIVYVACGPESLARDAGILVGEFGYEFEAAGVVDMFPHTAHFESIAVFSRPGA